MTVHPIHGVGSASLPGGPAGQAGGAAAAGHRPADLVDVSPAAILLRRLDAVLAESPARFQAVTALVAGRLDGRAAGAEPHQALALGRLSERFLAASAAGSPAPLVAEPPGAKGAPPTSAGPGLPNAAAVTAAMAAAAGPPRPPRAARRAAYRPEAGGDGAAREDGAHGGGILGALLAAVAGVVEAALEAALEEVPPEGGRRAPAGERP